MAKKIQEDWEKDFCANTAVGRQKERIRQARKEQKEHKAREKAEERKKVERAKALNQLLRETSANIEHMTKKNQDFNQFLKRLLKEGPFLLKSLYYGFGEYSTILLYLCFNPEDQTFSVGLSHSAVWKGKEDKIITNFSPKASRDEDFLRALCHRDNDFVYISSVLKELTFPKPTIKFFSIYFSHLM